MFIEPMGCVRSGLRRIVLLIALRLVVPTHPAASLGRTGGAGIDALCARSDRREHDVRGTAGGVRRGVRARVGGGGGWGQQRGGGPGDVRAAVKMARKSDRAALMAPTAC